MKNYFCKYILLFIILCVCGCSEQIECIDPEDWGTNLSVYVDANGKPQGPKPLTPPGVIPQLQYVDWQQGFRLNGKTVNIVINNPSQIYSQLNCNGTSILSSHNSWKFVLSDLIQSQVPCMFSPSAPDAAPLYPWCPKGEYQPGDHLSPTNAPCQLYMGMGLYTNIVKTSSSTATPIAPDHRSVECSNNIIDKTNCVKHIGDNACLNINDPSCKTGFINQLCPTGGILFDPPKDCNGSEGGACYIYLKILDLYYEDNAGGYNVTFKSGVYHPNLSFISSFIGNAQAILCNVTSTIYKNIVHDSGYLSYVRALLVLYIAFLGVAFMTGFVQFSSAELIKRVLKIAIVLQMATTNGSWEFWNTHFFSLFTQGVSDLTGMIFGNNGNMMVKVGEYANGCGFQNLAGFAQFDELIMQIISYTTSHKIMSLFVWKAGFLAILIIYLLILWVLWILLKTVIIYLVSYLAIALLISLAPIFLPFMLFQMTRSFFTQWLTNLISYAIQALVILTFAFFLLQIFTNQLQFLFGYRVCYKHYVTIPTLNIPIYAWQTDFNLASEPECILTPNPIFKSYSIDHHKDGQQSRKCPPFVRPKEAFL